MGFCLAVVLAAISVLPRDFDYIVKYAPPQDAPLPAEYVTNNCLLAAAARKSAIEEYPDEIYLEYVLPYSVIREGRDDWRGEFRERFAPLVDGMDDMYSAAVKLDRTIWDMIDVHYDTRRDQARQSPRHSMRIHMASCTGISIILIDACRAVGIPARLVGCRWTTIPGNHSWVEVWSRGGWHVLASGKTPRYNQTKGSSFCNQIPIAEAPFPGSKNPDNQCGAVSRLQPAPAWLSVCPAGRFPPPWKTPP